MIRQRCRRARRDLDRPGGGVKRRGGGSEAGKKEWESGIDERRCTNIVIVSAWCWNLYQPSGLPSWFMTSPTSRRRDVWLRATCDSSWGPLCRLTCWKLKRKPVVVGLLGYIKDLIRFLGYISCCLQIPLWDGEYTVRRFGKSSVARTKQFQRSLLQRVQYINDHTVFEQICLHFEAELYKGTNKNPLWEKTIYTVKCS